MARERKVMILGGPIWRAGGREHRGKYVFVLLLRDMVETGFLFLIKF